LNGARHRPAVFLSSDPLIDYRTTGTYSHNKAVESRTVVVHLFAILPATYQFVIDPSGRKYVCARLAEKRREKKKLTPVGILKLVTPVFI